MDQYLSLPPTYIHAVPPRGIQLNLNQSLSLPLSLSFPLCLVSACLSQTKKDSEADMRTDRQADTVSVQPAYVGPNEGSEADRRTDRRTDKQTNSEADPVQLPILPMNDCFAQSSSTLCFASHSRAPPWSDQIKGMALPSATAGAHACPQPQPQLAKAP